MVSFLQRLAFPLSFFMDAPHVGAFRIQPDVPNATPRGWIRSKRTVAQDRRAAAKRRAKRRAKAHGQA